MNLYFQVSNLSLAQQFAEILSRYIEFYKRPQDNSSNKTSSAKQEDFKTPPRKKQEQSNAYSVLNVSSDATKEEITSAYKKLAQRYHPDKVEGLGPEFKELAERRMKEINAAYKEVMSKFKE